MKMKEIKREIGKESRTIGVMVGTGCLFGMFKTIDGVESVVRVGKKGVEQIVNGATVVGNSIKGYHDYCRVMVDLSDELFGRC